MLRHAVDLGEASWELDRLNAASQARIELSALVTLISRLRDEDVPPEEYVAAAERLARRAADPPTRDATATARRSVFG